MLATRSPQGATDLVPITFAVELSATADIVLSAVDHKPKSTLRLARLVNIEHDPTVTLLFDERDDTDWSALWWVRARGRAVVRPSGHRRELFVARYPQYATTPPVGPVIEVQITGWQGWSAAP